MDRSDSWVAYHILPFYTCIAELGMMLKKIIALIRKKIFRIDQTG
jgi:hypothetical protein